MSAKSTVRYASSVTGVNFEKYLVWGAIGAGVYFVAWPALKGLFTLKAGVDAVIDTSRDALASGLYAIWGPAIDLHPIDHLVTFPNGQRHAVPAGVVKSDGTFINKNLSSNYAGDGRAYRILRDKAGAYSAFPV